MLIATGRACGRRGFTTHPEDLGVGRGEGKDDGRGGHIRLDIGISLTNAGQLPSQLVVEGQQPNLHRPDVALALALLVIGKQHELMFRLFLLESTQ